MEELAKLLVRTESLPPNGEVPLPACEAMSPEGEQTKLDSAWDQ
jgi:hypothetical protein